MTKKVDFLKSVISDATSENKSIEKWMGVWHQDVRAFLENWLSKDLENERNGRTDEEMACDLVDELLDMKKKNIVRIMTACYYLETARMPKDLETPFFGVLNFDVEVDNIVKVLEGRGDELEDYLRPRKR